MEELLKPLNINRSNKGEPQLQEVTSQSLSNDEKAKPKVRHPAPTSAQDALEVLRHEPDYDSLIGVLRFLSRHGRTDEADFPSIKLPSPLSAQLVQALVSDIVPNYWALLIEDVDGGKNSGLKLLLYCLSSVTAVNAVLVRLRALIQEAKSEAAEKPKRPDISLNLGISLDLISRLLQGDRWLLESWQVATSGQDGPARVRPRVHEILSTLGSSRVVSLAAEAAELAKDKRNDSFWPTHPLQYSLWLARNIVAWQLSDHSSTDTKFGPDLLLKALRLGHSGKLRQRKFLVMTQTLTSVRYCHQTPSFGPSPRETSRFSSIRPLVEWTTPDRAAQGHILSPENVIF